MPCHVIMLESPTSRFVFYGVHKKIETQTSGDSSDETFQHRVQSISQTRAARPLPNLRRSLSGRLPRAHPELLVSIRYHELCPAHR